VGSFVDLVDHLGAVARLRAQTRQVLVGDLAACQRALQVYYCQAGRLVWIGDQGIVDAPRSPVVLRD
jgi:hypothetical protein